MWPGSIQEINNLSHDEKCAIYHTLIPDWVFTSYGVDRQDFSVQGVRVVHIRAPKGSHTVELTVFHEPGAVDPLLYLQMGDTFHSQLMVLLAIVNDPYSPRFNIDVDETGRPTNLGTEHRNIPEEIRALEAGFAPGQVRRGLRIFRTAIPMFENFVQHMGYDLFFIEPLFYHNAIIFERYGFVYSRGLQTMKHIHQEFQPGGTLHSKLKGDTPFRSLDAWQTITGRSWAIHDGILGHPFTGIQMYKRIHHDANIETFPGAQW